MGIITGSFESKERENAVLTLPNAMTAIRAVGGVVLGVEMARGNISPAVAAGSAIALAATDAEGTIINVAEPYPEIRDSLRIWPSKLGRMTDVVADKVYVAGVLSGGMTSGTVPKTSGTAILATEVATSVATAYTTKKLDKEPRVSKIGKAGMIGRVAAVSSYFASKAIPNSKTSQVFEKAGHISTAAAVVLGALSCADIIRQSR